MKQARQLDDIMTQYDNREKQTHAATVFAHVVGSWKFIIIQSMFMLFYLAWNILPGFFHFDPYPFTLLNLVLSFQAAYTGPVILMAQNVQDEKDREIVYKDFELSLSAERDIRKVLAITRENESEIELILEYIKKSSDNNKRGN
jgi:uncharacterized membrane protein